MGKPVEKKKGKKKGRPSLLDLQKRSLRLQKQQQEKNQKNPNPNPSPNPNPYLRFPNSPSARRVPARRNHIPAEDDGGAAGDDDDDDEEGDSNRKEKELKLVLRIPNGSANSQSESDADGEISRKKRKIDAVETGRQNSGSKATEPLQGTGEPSDSGPTTPLPDKKLLVFILDRLQKKDTYGVFADPVDPNELPDYHNIIQNPMDFGTVRKKLAAGAYANLEQFENDVFLICSNAMRYNSPDTIYYRQARAMQELAKKDFENLRQESDNEPEPKIVRRGRPPSKNTIKRMVGRPPGRTSSDLPLDATLANSLDGPHWSNSTHDSSRKVMSFVKPGTADAPSRAPHGLRCSETYRWNSNNRTDRNEEYSGSSLKGVSMKHWKKNSVIDENRRSTYNESQYSTCSGEPSVLTAFDGEKKQLVPVGLSIAFAYARSLARFAANLGPCGWEIAAKRIERVLPPGTKFGPGWVGEEDVPQQSQLPIPSTSPPQPSSQPKMLPSSVMPRDDRVSESQEPASSNSAIEESPISSAHPPSAPASATATPCRSSDSGDGAASTRGSNQEGAFHLMNNGTQPKAPLHLHQNVTMLPRLNGFGTAFGFNMSAQADKSMKLLRPPGGVGAAEVAMTHGRVLDMVSRNGSNSFFSHHAAPVSQVDTEEGRLVGNVSRTNLGRTLPNSSHGHDLQGQWRGLPLIPKSGSVPPDLNVGFQSPASPVPGMMADSQQQQQQQQQPDLALQL